MTVDNSRAKYPRYVERPAWLESLDVDPSQGPRRPGKRRLAARAWGGTWPVALAIVIVLTVWQLIHLSGWKKNIFPGPGATLANLWDQLRPGLLWHAIGTTAERAAGGFRPAVVIAAAIAALASRVPPLRAAAWPLVTGLRS